MKSRQLPGLGSSSILARCLRLRVFGREHVQARHVRRVKLHGLIERLLQRRHGLRHQLRQRSKHRGEIGLACDGIGQEQGKKRKQTGQSDIAIQKQCKSKRVKTHWYS